MQKHIASSEKVFLIKWGRSTFYHYSLISICTLCILNVCQKVITTNCFEGSQQCIVTINSDSGWSGIPDVRYEDASTLEGSGGDDDEDGISFFNLFIVSIFKTT